MSASLNRPQDIAARLTDAWLPECEEDLAVVLAALAEAASGLVAIRQIGLSTFASGSIFNLSQIRLHGMDEVPCLLLALKQSVANDIQEFCQFLPVGRLGIVFTLTDDTYLETKRLAPARQLMPVSPKQVRELLTAADGRNVIRKMLLTHFPRLALVPFNLLRPADAHMFFGRRFDLNRLLHQPNVSFALSGPEGLGKTSLLRQYERELILTRDPRTTARVYINFLACPSTNDAEIARYLKMRIDPRKSSSEVTYDRDEIVRFFKRQRAKWGNQPLELLLDDVDEVCRSGVFQALGICARDGICRLILAGRSGLLEMLLDKWSDLKGRLDVIRLEPLDDEAASVLLLGPLRDLGWSVERPEEFCAILAALTGRLPHLLQFCGKKICEMAIKRNLASITPDLIEEIKWDFDTLNFITAALRGIKNEQLRKIAIALVKRNPRGITATTVQRVARDNGIYLEYEAAEDCCKRLVLESVLSWHKGEYQLASAALPEYAEKQGLFADMSQAVSVSR